MYTALSLLFRADLPTVLLIFGMVFTGIGMSVDESGKPKPAIEVECKSIKETNRDADKDGLLVFICEQS